MLVFTKFVLFVLLFVLCLIFSSGIVALKNIGDSCSLRNGDVGICRSLTNCPVAALLSVAGKMPETCGVQTDNIVVCCGQSLHTQLFRDSNSIQDSKYVSEKRIEDNQTYDTEDDMTSHRRSIVRPPREQSSSENIQSQLTNRKDVAEYYYSGTTNLRQTERTSTLRNQYAQTPKNHNSQSSDKIAFPSEPEYNIHRQIYAPPERLPVNSKPSRTSTNKPLYDITDSLHESRPQPLKPNKPFQSSNFNEATQRPNRPIPQTYKPYQDSTIIHSNQYKPTESSQYYKPNIYTTTTSYRSTNKPYRASQASSSQKNPYQSNSENSQKHQPIVPQVKPVWKPIQSQQEINRPHYAYKRISEIKCDEYSEDVRDKVAALPLLPNPDPVSVHVEKCDYNGVKLIVGGEKTVPGEFPHMAAVGFRDDGNNIAWNCGGTLISEYYVLTAAHCTYTSLGTPVMVRLGELNLKRSDDGAQPVDYAVSEVIRHPDYRPPAKYHDIGLLKLNRRVEFNKFIRPACLYTKDNFVVNKTTAIGWGKIDFAEDPSDILLKVVLSIIDNDLCNDLYQSDIRSRTLPKGIAQSMMCAGELAGGKDTCQGDSGGPIQITDRTNRCIHYVIGVTSFGKFCAGKNAPGVYTRVSHYVPWIESVVWPAR